MHYNRQQNGIQTDAKCHDQREPEGQGVLVNFFKPKDYIHPVTGPAGMILGDNKPDYNNLKLDLLIKAFTSKFSLEKRVEYITNNKIIALPVTSGLQTVNLSSLKICVHINSIA